MYHLYPMFRIRDIFVRILIRILGSVPLTNFSGCGFERLKNIGIRVRNTGTCLSFFKAVLRIRNKSFGSGTVPLTNGSGSGRSKNMQIRIRILNTDQTFEGLPSATKGLLKKLLVWDGTLRYGKLRSLWYVRLRYRKVRYVYCRHEN
jgi:hypothetical protein